MHHACLFLAHLRIEHAQNVSQFEIEHRILLEKMEKNMKNRTIQMLEEEVSRITSNCKAVLQNLIQSIEQYKNENVSTKYVYVFRMLVRVCVD